MLPGTTRLVFARRGSQTVLATSSSELPLQVQRAIAQPDGGALVTLLTPAGALLAGDAIHLEVECGPGTAVTLRQTGATRLHRCDVGAIEVRAEVRVAEGARFYWAPFELIPFAGAAYRQVMHVEVAASGEASVLEVVAPGRLQERFTYQKLDLLLEVVVAGQRVVRDRQVLEPATMDLRRSLAGFSHVGSLVLVGPGVDQARADVAHEALVGGEVLGSASLLAGSQGLAARVLGHSAEAVRTALQRLVRE